MLAREREGAQIIRRHSRTGRNCAEGKKAHNKRASAGASSSIKPEAESEASGRPGATSKQPFRDDLDRELFSGLLPRRPGPPLVFAALLLLLLRVCPCRAHCGPAHSRPLETGKGGEGRLGARALPSRQSCRQQHGPAVGAARLHRRGAARNEPVRNCALSGPPPSSLPFPVCASEKRQAKNKSVPTPSDNASANSAPKRPSIWKRSDTSAVREKASKTRKKK